MPTKTATPSTAAEARDILRKLEERERTLSATQQTEAAHAEVNAWLDLLDTDVKTISAELDAAKERFAIVMEDPDGTLQDALEAYIAFRRLATQRANIVTEANHRLMRLAPLNPDRRIYDDERPHRPDTNDVGAHWTTNEVIGMWVDQRLAQPNETTATILAKPAAAATAAREAVTDANLDGHVAGLSALAQATSHRLGKTVTVVTREAR